MRHEFEFTAHQIRLTEVDRYGATYWAGRCPCGWNLETNHMSRVLQEGHRHLRARGAYTAIIHPEQAKFNLTLIAKELERMGHGHG